MNDATDQSPININISQAPLPDVYQHLQCDGDGLTTDEAARRLEQFARNPKPQRPLIAQFLGFLWNPICWMLEASAFGLLILSSGNHRPPDWPTFLGLLFLLSINAALGVFAERRGFRAVSGLIQSEKFSTIAKVKRDGVWSDIDASQLVRGDIIALKAEDFILATCRLTSGSLYIDAPWQDENRKRVGDLCLPGHKLTSGECEAIVIATDNVFPAGRSNGSGASLNAIVAQISIFCLALVFILLVAEVLVLYAAFHYSYHRGISAIFVLLIGSIPIALPTVVSITLSLGVDELAGHGVLTTRVAAVEELARVTVVCVERSTLTEEEYTIRDVATYGPFSAAEVLLMSAYAQSTDPQSQSPAPLRPRPVYLEYMGGGPAGHPDIEIVHYQPLSIVGGPIRVTYRMRGSRQLKRVAKGMLGHIAGMATRNFTNALADRLDVDVEDFATRGIRTCGLAYEELQGDDPEADGNGFEMAGIVGFSQPLRENTQRAVAEALDMGLQMKMVTSDQLSIAKETGRQLGLGDIMYPGKVFREEKYQGIPPDGLILDAVGFAGVYPTGKQQLFQRLQHMGHFCAMISKGACPGSAANVTFTVNAGGDLRTAQPSFPTVVDAIRCSRKIFRRLHGCCIYTCAICIRTALCFSLLAFIYKINFPPFIILLITLATNLSILTLSLDRAIPGTKPGRWDLTEIFSYSTAYGVYMALSTVFFIHLTTKTNLFQRTFGLTLPPSQPLHDNELHMLIYLQVAQISQALVFIVRSNRFFFNHRPSTAVLGVFCVAQICSSIIAAYGNWEFAQVHAVDARWIGVVWVWNIIWFIPLDLIKFVIGLALKARNLDVI
ncbi:hypothetical protein B0H19DRAFT_1189852 [Mycena capillaripes]|nr:hypothetical protein B0H19DRAFT_1189852 [Mycena capillaripes]